MPDRAIAKREPEYKELLFGHPTHQGEMADPTPDAPTNTQVDPYDDPTYKQPSTLIENQTTEPELFSPETKECIEECRHCHEICLSQTMNHCLEAGGTHTEPHHFRLLMSCAEICQTSANFGLMNSPFHGLVCSVCSQVCEACAKLCDEIEGMMACAAACRKCARSCSKMAQIAV